MNGFRSAASLLTTIPVGRGTAGRSDAGGSVSWFPFVGALVGLAVAGVYASSGLVLPPFMAATVGVGAGVFLTGALHEDGLADTADAFGGGWDRAEALRIMKDPVHGTFGVVAIAFSVLIRVAALATLDGWTALAVLPTAHALSRGAAAGLLVLPPVTEGGLGSSYARAATRRGVTAALVSAVLIGAVATGIWAVPAAGSAALAAWLVGRASLRKIGGITGDVLGAAEQVAEILMLVLAAAFAANGWPSPAWWR